MRFGGKAALALWIGIAAITPRTAAETRTADGVTYERPADPAWKESTIEGGNLYQWDFTNGTNGRRGSALLIVTGSAGFLGNLDAALVKLMDSTGMLVGAEPTQQHRGVATDGQPMVWAMRAGSTGGNPNSDAVVAVVCLQQSAGLASAMMILVNLDDARRDYVDATFNALAGSLRMGGAIRPPLPTPTGGSQQLSGTYIYTVTNFVMNPMGGTSMNMEWKLRQFDPRGYYADRPVLAGESFDTLCMTAPTLCGTYRVDGGQITLAEVERFGLVETHASKFTVTAKGFNIGGYPYEMAQPVPSTLSGSWRFNQFTSGPNGSITVIKQIDFTADGRYARTGFAGATINDPVSGTSGTTSGTDPEQSGTYRIDGFTLSLTSASGATAKMSLVATDPADLKYVFLDGDLYARVDR